MTDFEMISRATVNYANTSKTDFEAFADSPLSFDKNLESARNLLTGAGSNKNITADFKGVVYLDEANFFSVQVSAFTEHDLETANAKSVILHVPPLKSRLNPSFCLITNINTAYGKKADKLIKNVKVADGFDQTSLVLRICDGINVAPSMDIAAQQLSTEEKECPEEIDLGITLNNELSNSCRKTDLIKSYAQFMESEIDGQIYHISLFSKKFDETGEEVTIGYTGKFLNVINPKVLMREYGIELNETENGGNIEVASFQEAIAKKVEEQKVIPDARQISVVLTTSLNHMIVNYTVPDSTIMCRFDWECEKGADQRFLKGSDLTVQTGLKT